VWNEHSVRPGVAPSGDICSGLIEPVFFRHGSLADMLRPNDVLDRSPPHEIESRRLTAIRSDYHGEGMDKGRHNERYASGFDHRKTQMARAYGKGASSQMPDKYEEILKSPQ
jgi:hypothetical protein